MSNYMGDKSDVFYFTMSSKSDFPSSRMARCVGGNNDGMLRREWDADKPYLRAH